MSRAAWILCALWIAAALGSAVVLGARAVRAGLWRHVRGRLASPTVYLFAAYLGVAALVTPRSAGEAASPLLGLALALPIAYAAASLAAAGSASRSRLAACALAVVHGGAVLSIGAVVLALTSPAFVPAWLR